MRGEPCGSRSFHYEQSDETSSADKRGGGEWTPERESHSHGPRAPANAPPLRSEPASGAVRCPTLKTSGVTCSRRWLSDLPVPRAACGSVLLDRLTPFPPNDNQTWRQHDKGKQDSIEDKPASPRRSGRCSLLPLGGTPGGHSTPGRLGLRLRQAETMTSAK